MFLNPVTIIKRTGKIFKELSLLSFYKKQKRKMQKNGELSLYNLSKDWFGNLYTVVNLQPELKLYNTGKTLEKEEKRYIGSEMSKILPMFEKHDVYELVKMKIKRIDNGNRYGYGVLIKFNWNYTSFWWILWLLMFYSGLGYGIYYLITTYLMAPAI